MKEDVWENRKKILLLVLVTTKEKNHFPQEKIMGGEH
jgi:hypothetical protein